MLAPCSVELLTQVTTSRFLLKAEKVFKLANEDAESVMESMIRRHKSLFMEVGEMNQQAQRKQKEQYKKCKGLVDYNFKIGDEVLLRCRRQEKVTNVKTGGWVHSQLLN